MRISVRGKLAAYGLLAILCITFCATIAFVNLDKINKAVESQTTFSTAIRNHLESDMMHDALRADVFAALLAESESDFESVNADTADHAGNFRSRIDANKKLDLPDSLTSKLDDVAEPLATYIAAAEEIIGLAQENRADAEAQLPQFIETFETLEVSMAEISDAMEAEAQQSEKHAASIEGAARRQIIGAFAVSVLALLGTAWVVSRSIVNPLTRSLKSVEALARKDLTSTIAVASRDEIGRMASSLNTAYDELKVALGQISQHANTLASSSDELSVISSQMRSGAESTSSQTAGVSVAGQQVSSNIQQVATAIDGLVGSTQDISASAAEATRVANEAKEVADHAVADVRKLNEVSAEIDEVIQVIGRIAEQTNLLALNATIEAARAGEAGRGFSVVAAEVRELANETTGATNSIADKILRAQNQAHEASQSIERIARIVEDIVGHQATVGAAVEEQVAATSEISRNISQAVDGADQISTAMQSVNSVAAETADGAGATNQSATELGRLASELRSLVGEFAI